MFNPPGALHYRLRPPMRMETARKLQEDYLRNLRLMQLQRNIFFPTLRCPFPLKPFPLRPSVFMFSRQEQRCANQTSICNTITKPICFYQNLLSCQDVNDNSGMGTNFQPHFEVPVVNRFRHSDSSASPLAIECQRPEVNSPELKKSFSCPQCKYTTDRKNNLKRHVITMHFDCDRTLECCGSTFRSKAKLREHVLLFHKDGYRCLICHRTFCRKALLRRHMAVHSGRKDFICDLCDYATSHKSNLERHQKVHLKARGPKQAGENVNFVHRKYERKTLKISSKTRGLKTQDYAIGCKDVTQNYTDDALNESYCSPNLYSITEDENIEFSGIRTEEKRLGKHKINELLHPGKQTNISFDTVFEGAITETVENNTEKECQINTLDENCNNISTTAGSSVITGNMAEKDRLFDNNSKDIHLDNAMAISGKFAGVIVRCKSSHATKTDERKDGSLQKNVEILRYENVSYIKPTEFRLYSEFSGEKRSTRNTENTEVHIEVSNCETNTSSDCEGTVVEGVEETKAVRVLPIKSIPSINAKTISETTDDKPVGSIGVNITTHHGNTEEAIDSKYGDIAQIKDSQRLCILPYRCATCKNRFKIQIDFLHHICEGSEKGDMKYMYDTSAFPLLSEQVMFNLWLFHLMIKWQHFGIRPKGVLLTPKFKSD